MNNDPAVWNEEYQAEAVRLAKQVREGRHRFFMPRYQERLLLADALMHALAAPLGTAENPCPRCHYNAGPEGAERYWEARWRDEKAENERLQHLADERAKELATLRGEPVRITGAISLVEEAACLIWHELYPDTLMDEADLPHYEAAAKAVLALAPDWKQDQAETPRLAGEVKP